MINELPTPPSPAPPRAHPDEFVVYHWANPRTDCEYPYLAINTDRSVLLSMGEYSLGFDFELPADTERWLSEDYAPTELRFQLNLAAMQYLIEQTFAGSALFGFVNYDEDLAIRSVELSLSRQETADCGPEYVVHALGDYQRWYRQSDLYTPVTLAERALLDVCCSTFQTLSGPYRHLVSAPPTPSFQEAKAPGPSQ